MTIIRLYILIVLGGLLGCRPNDSARQTSPSSQHTNPQNADSPVDSAEETSLIAFNLNDEPVDPFLPADVKAVAFIFARTDCPIVNRYAPEMNRLYHEFESQKISFWLVYADPTENLDQIRHHLAEYSLRIPALVDREHRLVKYCGVSRTPEAAVFTTDRVRRYRGRIDDRFTDYGKSREFASQHNLSNALEALLSGKEIDVPETKAIGCYILGVDE